MTLDDGGDVCNVFPFLGTLTWQLYSMIRDPRIEHLERTVTEEVATGKAAEQDQNGGLQADK